MQGIVFDSDTKQRLTRVYIYNTRTGTGFYNTTKGEFKTNASEGDILVAALQGYGVDTLSVKAENTILFCFGDTCFCNSYRIFRIAICINRNSNLPAKNL